jgi:uncharacterized protein
VNQEVAQNSLAQKLQIAEEFIRPLDRAIIAFSGGVDSTLVLKMAFDILGKGAIAATAVSASLPERERNATIELAQSIGVEHRLLYTNEIENSDYAANNPNRCFFCKTELYSVLQQMADDEGFTKILNGTNLDDMGDFRPGLKAADQHQVLSPLKEAGINKAEVRLLAKQLGLPNWDKPAMACLSSRIQYGVPVKASTLNQIEAAELVLLDLGFDQLRVRHHEKLARIEVLPEDFPLVMKKNELIVTKFRELGYNYVTLDLIGFRSGSMNETLRKNPNQNE